MGREKNLFILLGLLIAFAVSCTKSGSLTGNASPSSVNGTLTGSVNGGLSPVSGALVSLYVSGTTTPIGTATTSSTGAFTMSYTTPSGSNALIAMATGGSAGSNGANSNIQLGAIVGLASNIPSSVVINEATSAALFNVGYGYGGVSDANGAVSFPATNSSASANMATQYANLITNGTLNSGLGNANQTVLAVMANAIAACVENAGNCSSLYNNAVNASQSAAANIEDALYNMTNATANVGNLFTLAKTVTSSTGFLIPSTTPSTLYVLPMVTQTTLPVGSSPLGNAIDASGNVWTTMSGGNTVYEISPTGVVLGTFTVGTNPSTLAIDANGNIWVSNFSTSNISELSSAGTTLGTFSTGGANPIGIAIDATGNIWAVNRSSNTLVKFNASGMLLNTYTTCGPSPRSIAIDSGGNLWISNDLGHNSITKVTPLGALAGTFAVSSMAPLGLIVDGSGNVWVNGLHLYEFNPAGTLLQTISAGNGGVGNGGIAIDATSKLWLDGSNTNVINLTSSGAVLGSFAVGGSLPAAIAIDASGNLWSSNRTGNSVTKLPGVTLGPQFFPYSGPIFASSAN